MRSLLQTVILAAIWFVVGIVGASVVATWVGSLFSIMLGIALITIAIVGAVRRWPILRKLRTARGLAIAWIGILLILLNNLKDIKRGNEELATLRKVDPPAYLERVRNMGDLSKWLDELRELDRPAFDAEMRHRNEAEIAVLRKEWEATPLVDLARAVPLATRLAELEPLGIAEDGTSWTKKRDDVTAQLAAQQKRMEEAGQLEAAKQEAASLQRRQAAEAETLRKEWQASSPDDLPRTARIAARLAELEPSGAAPDGTFWTKKRDDVTAQLAAQQKRAEEARQAEAARLAALDQERRARLNPERAIVLGTSARRGGFGTTMHVNFTINNQNSFAVKDIVIYCEAKGSSGTTIQTFDKTLYIVAEPRRTLKVPNVIMGFLNDQVSSYSCEPLAATAL